MSRPEDLAERIERLVLRHEELKRTNVLLSQQLSDVSAERDSLRSRLAAARARIDALLDRLPADGAGTPRAVVPALPPPPSSTRPAPPPSPPDTDAA